MFEPIESRVYLSAYTDHNFTQAEKNGVIDSIARVAAWAESLDNYQQVATPIAGVNRSMGKALDLSDAIMKGIYQPVVSFFQSQPLASASQLVNRLKTLSATAGNLTVSVDPSTVAGGFKSDPAKGDEVSFQLVFNVSRSLPTPVDLGDRWQALRLNADASGVAPLVLTAAMPMTFGYGGGNFTGAPNQVFARLGTISMAANASSPDMNFGLDLGFLGMTVQHGSLSIQAQISAAILNPDNDVNNCLNFAELTGPISATASLAASGSSSVTLPVKATLGTFNAAGSPQVSLNSANFYLASPTMQINSDFSNLLNFSAFTAIDFHGLLGQVGNLFDLLRSSQRFARPPPWIDSSDSTLGTVMDYRGAYLDAFLTPLSSAVNAPTYHNAQTFATQAAAVLGVSTAFLGGDYNPATRELSYHISLSRALPAVAADIDLSSVPAPLKITNGIGQLSLTATPSLDMVISVKVVPLVATIGGAADAPSNGRFTGTSSFTIGVGSDSPVAVVVSGDSSNASIADLLVDFNSAINATALNGKVLAGRSGNKLTFSTLGAGVVPSITLNASALDPIIAQFGFAVGQSNAQSLTQSVSLSGVTLGGTLTGTGAGLAAAGLLGYLNINSSGASGSFAASMNMKLIDPLTATVGGKATLDEFQSRIATGLDSIATTLSLAGTAGLTLPLRVNPVMPGLAAAAPVASVTWSDISNPSAIAVTFNADAAPLRDLSSLSAGDITSLFSGLNTWLAGVQSVGLLAQALPGLNRSLPQFADIPAALAKKTAVFSGNPAYSVQFLATNLELAMALPDNAVSVFMDGHLLRINFDLTQSLNSARPIDLDLASLAGLLTAGDPAKASLQGLSRLIGGSVPVNGVATLKVRVGIDLTNPGSPAPFVDESSQLSIDLAATATSLNFNATAGALQLIVQGGSFTIGGDTNPATNDALRAVVSLVPGGTGRRALSQLTAGVASVSLTGAAAISLPLYFPTGATGLGTLTLQVANLSNLAGTLSLTAPNLAGKAASIDLSANLGVVISGVEQMLGRYQTALNAQVLGNSFPLIGDALSKVNQFLADDLRNIILTRLHERLDGASQKSISLVQNALYDALGPSGLNVLSPTTSFGDYRDVAYTTQTGGDGFTSRVQFNLHLKKTATLLSAPIAFNLGLAAVGLSLNTNVTVSAGYDLFFNFGVDRDLGFYIDASPAKELDLALNVTIPSGTITGKLGFLTLRVTDNPATPTSFSGNFAIDFLSPHTTAGLPDFQTVTSNDVLAGITDASMLSAALNATAAVRLKAVTAFADSAQFPTLKFDFALDWKFLPGQSDLTGNIPKVAFNNVQLSLGRFFSSYTTPIINQVQEVIAPIKEIVDLLAARLPLISDLAGKKYTLIKLAQDFGFAEGAEAVETVAGIVNLISSVPTTIGDDTYINLGSFDLGGTNVKIRNDLTGIIPNVTGVENPIAQLDNVSKKFIDNAKDIDDTGYGMVFPILENPLTVFRLLLKQEVSLFAFNLPEVKFKFKANVSVPLPVPVPLSLTLAGRVEVHGKLAFGFDTHGLSMYDRTGDPAALANGFYISTRSNPDGTGEDVSVLDFVGRLDAGLELSLGVVSGGVTGGIELTLKTYLQDPNGDGRLHADEIAGAGDDGLHCAIKVVGEIAAVAAVHVTVLGKDIDYDFARVVLYGLDTLPEECKGDRFDPNNSLLAAADLGVGPGQHITLVGIQHAESDWFKITLLRADSVKFMVHADDADGQINIEVTDDAGTILGQSATPNDDDVVSLKNLAPGNYFVRVFGAVNSYELSVEPGPTSTTRVIYVTLHDGFDLAKNFYTLQAGDDAQDGLSARTPKATLQGVINTITLSPTDLVVIDTGKYTQPVVIPGSQAGVIYTGTPYTIAGTGTVFNEDAAWVINNSGNWLYRLRFVSDDAARIKNTTAITTGTAAANNLIQNNTFTGNFYGLVDNGDATTFDRNTVKTEFGIKLNPASRNSTVKRSDFISRYPGIAAFGNNALITSNTFTQADPYDNFDVFFSLAIYLDGAGNQVKGNDIKTNDGIEIHGINHVIQGNSLVQEPPLSPVATRGLRVFGTSLVIRDNDISAFYRGIDAIAGGSAIFANRVHHNTYGLNTESAGVVVGPSDPQTESPNEFDHNVIGLLFTQYASNGVVRFNKIHDNGTGVFSGSATTSVFGNDIYANTTGVQGQGTIGPSDWSTPNLIHDNGTGIHFNVAGTDVARFNRIYSNQTGILASVAVSIHHNVIYLNAQRGIALVGANGSRVVNNTIYTITGRGLEIGGSSVNTVVRNNIFRTDGGYGVYVATDSQVGFDSDYNNLYRTGAGKIYWFQKDFDDLYDWQIEADLDLHSIGYIRPEPTLDDPQFVDLANHDFHLKNKASTSIDAADPATAFGLEPGANGGRADLGAYGNTTDAAQSFESYIRVEYPNLYLDWEAARARTILWSTYNVTGKVRVELWLDGAGKIVDIATVDYNAPGVLWSPQASSITPDSGKRYRLKIVLVADASVVGTAREFFVVPPTSANYYVNDSSTASDEFTSVAGDNRNTGRSPNAPKADVLPILRSYVLTGNDVIRVDTGSYVNVRNLSINVNTGPGANPGTGLGDDQGFSLVGPTNAARVAYLDRANPYSYAVHVDLDQASFVTLSRLTLVGGYRGVYVHNLSTNFSADHLVISGNTDDGVRLDSTATGATLDALTVFDNGGYGVFSDAVIPSFSNSTVYGNGNTGVALNKASNTLIRSNVIHDNHGHGLMAIGLSSGGLTQIGGTNLDAGYGNVVYNNFLNGINASGFAQGGMLIAGNNVYGHKNPGSIGIFLSGSGDLITLNTVHDNLIGISAGGESITYNRVYNNDSDGIRTGGNAVVEGNIVYGNATGIHDWWASGGLAASLISHNTVYGNSFAGIHIDGAGTAATHSRIHNNTLYQTAGTAVRIETGAAYVELRNNIVVAPGATGIRVHSDSQVGFSSDYNLLYAPGGAVGYWQLASRASLNNWRFASFTDTNSLGLDPLFVDAANGDFHLRSLYGSVHGGSLAPVLGAGNLPVANPGSLMNDGQMSPAIDRGDASFSFASEPAANGAAVDLGAYGNTPQSSRSPSAFVLVTDPQQSAVWPAGQSFTIRWRTQDSAGHVNVQLFRTGSGSPVLTLASSAPNTGSYLWSIPLGLAVAGDYFIRVSRSDATASDDSDAFTIAPVTHDYYVNDTGDDTNDGLTPATAKYSIRAMLEAYHLGAADTIHVDAGVYILTTNIIITPDDSGVKITGYFDPGSPNTAALLERRNLHSGSYVFEFAGADNVQLDHLWMTGARTGIYAATGAGSTGLVISNNRIYQNWIAGIVLGTSNDGANIYGNEVFGTDQTVNAMPEDPPVGPFRLQPTGIQALTDDSQVSNNHVYALLTSAQPTGIGIEIQGLRNSVHGNQVDHYLVGIRAWRSALAPVAPGDANVIDANVVHDNLMRGIEGVFSGSFYSTPVTIRNNTVYNQKAADGAGIYGGDTVTGNFVFDNTDGILASAVVTSNRVYRNTRAGINVGPGSLVQGNQVYNNGVGVVSQGRVLNNVIYLNGEGVQITSAGGNANAHPQVLHNTIYQTSGVGVRVSGSSSYVEVRNNIFVSPAGTAMVVASDSQTGFASDYNLIRTSGSATVGLWGAQSFASITAWASTLNLDPHSFSADPQFVNPSGVDGVMGYDAAAKVDRGADDNFHLQSTSPAIDAGDPGSYYLSEPQPNGGRVNLGSDGNTLNAAATPSPSIQVVSPNGGENFQVGDLTHILWNSTGLAQTRPTVYINAGGPTVGRYLFNAYQVTPIFQDGVAINQAVDISGVTDPAPQAVYQRYTFGISGVGQAITYALPVPDGTYTVRLHFVEPVASFGAGFRTFDIKLNGATVAAAFDPYAAAGGSLKAVARSYATAASDGTGITLDLVSLSANFGALISAIEVTNTDPAGVADPRFNLEVSVNNGASYALIASNVAVNAFGSGDYTWTVGPVSSGASAIVRVTSAQQPGVSDVSNQPFQIAPASKNYYVNDSSTSGDQYTTTIGNDGNSGASPDSPMASIQALLAAYNPGAGATIYVDTGNYTLLQNITLTASNAGLRIVGPSNAAAVLNRNSLSSGSYVFDIQAGVNNIVIDHLSITGALEGIHTNQAFIGSTTGLVITGNRIYGNRDRGINLAFSVNNAVVSGNTLYGIDGSFNTIQTTGIQAGGQYASITANEIYLSGGTVGGFLGGTGISLPGQYNVVSNNSIHDNAGTGIYLGSNNVATGNTVFANPVGIYVSYSSQATDNIVYDNGDGIRAYDAAALVTRNRVYHNTNAGIALSSSAIARGNFVYSNAIGVLVQNAFGAAPNSQVVGNLIYDNTSAGIQVQSANSTNSSLRVGITGNTIFQPVGYGVELKYNSHSVDLADNIISVNSASGIYVPIDSGNGFTSDYNLFQITGAGNVGTWGSLVFTSLDKWFYELGLDGNSIAADPRFVNPAGVDALRGYIGGVDHGADDNFHLRDDSPAIDAGDPTHQFLYEPGPNGARVNIGHDGNTPLANSSSAKIVQVLSPIGREKLITGKSATITWHTDGFSILSLVALINAGGPAVGMWNANTFQTAGSSLTNPNPINTSGLVSAAPAAIYQTYAAAAFGVGERVAYRIPVADGDYVVRLQFVEPYASAGSRIFDIVLQGQVAVAGYDPAADAGAINKAVQKTLGATASSGDGLLIELVNVASQAILSGIEVYRVVPDGAASPTFDVQLSTDGGSSWNTIGTQQPVDRFGNGAFNWTAGPISSNDLVRVIPAGGGPSGQSRQKFLIANAGHDYYINDGSTAGDSVTTNTGDNFATGKTPGDPMSSLAALLAAYKPHAGDVIHVDSGTYLLPRNIRLTADHDGLLIQGPSDVSAVFSRGISTGFESSGFADFELVGVTGLTLNRLRITGADVGVWGTQPATGFGSDKLTVSNSQIYLNGGVGILLLPTNTRATVTRNLLYGNPQTGYLDKTVQYIGINVSADDAVISYNNVHDSQSSGISVQGNRVVVSSNTVYSNYTGIRDNYAARITGNTVYNNTLLGIGGLGSSVITGNTVYGQNQSGATGIASSGQTFGNTVYDNDIGITVGGGVASGNRVFHNTRSGIQVQYQNAAVTNNRVYSNGVGIEIIGDPFYGRVESNLIYNNANQGILVKSTGQSTQPARLHGNTIYQPVGDAIRIQYTGFNIDRYWDVRGNILVVNAGYAIYVSGNGATGFTSDYNLFFKGPASNVFIGFFGGASRSEFADWKSATGQDAHGLVGDPLFVDMNGADNIFAFDTTQGLDGGTDDNFQLSAGSPAIDRADSWNGPATDLFGGTRVDDPGTPNAGSPEYFLSQLGSSLFTETGTQQFLLTVSVSPPFTFQFYGKAYTSIFATSTGFIYLGGTDLNWDGNNSTARLTANTWIAPLWDNITTTKFFVDSSISGQYKIRWQGVNNANNQPVNFAVVLFSDGSIRFDYGSGNTGLTPTIGISRGDGQRVILAPFNGQSTLTNANSVLYSLGAGVTDIGAIEFRGSSTDTTPAVVVSTNPSVINVGGSTGQLITLIGVTFSKTLNSFDANAQALYELRSKGADNAFGTADDTVYTLFPSNAIDSPLVTLAVPAGPLQPGDYRLTIFSNATRALHDASGLALDGDGNGNAGGDYVRVFNIGTLNILPSAALDRPVAINEGATLVLAGSFADPDTGQTWSATVNYGDGTGDFPVVLYPDKTFSLSHRYDFRGSYAISFTVTDSLVGSATASTTLQVNAVNPSAAFTNNGPIDEGQSGTVSFTNVYHPSNAVTAGGFTYSFDFDNDGTFDYLNSTSPVGYVPYSYVSGSLTQLTVRGRVTDSTGAYSEYTTTLIVNNLPPQVYLNPSTFLSEGDRYYQVLYLYDPGQNETYSGTVDYGDGGGEQALSIDPYTRGFVLDHVYASAGNYTLTLKVGDDRGATATATSAISVKVVPPFDAYAYDIYGTALESIYSYVAYFVPMSGTVAGDYTAAIDWGDGTSSAGQIYNFGVLYVLGYKSGYTAGGEYAVKTRIDGPGGKSVTVESVAHVAPAVPVAGDDSAITAHDTPIDIRILDNDRARDPNATLDPAQVYITTEPAQGTYAYNTLTGVLTYTPAAGFVGDDYMDYYIVDSNGTSSYIASIYITVSGTDNAPPTASPDSASTPRNQAAQIDVLANDSDSDGTLNPASVAIIASPLHGTVTVNGVTGVVTYTPNPGYFGSDSFSYTVRDNLGAKSDPAVVSIEVAFTVKPPVAGDDSATTKQDNSVVIAVLANDSDTDGTVDPTTVAIVSSPLHGLVSIDPQTGTITYTPATGYFGGDVFTYTVRDNDGGLSNMATVGVTVERVNKKPVAAADSATTDQATPVGIDLLANDGDPDGTLNPSTVAVLSGPSHGGVDVDPLTGVVTYTPFSGYYGGDSFQYWVADNEGAYSNVAVVTLTVNRINTAPVANNDNANTQQGTPIGINALDNDDDPDGTLDPATLAIVGAASHGTTSVNPTTGVITYTPDSGFSGFDTFVYTVRDNDGATSNQATVTVAVATANLPPTARDDSATTDQGSSVNINVLGNDSDSDGTIAPATLAIVTDVQHGSLVVNPATGVVTYIPQQAFYGVEQFTYTVKDNAGATSNTATVSITVNRVNQAPIAGDDSATTTHGVPVTIAVLSNDSDPDGAIDSSSIIIEVMPTHGTVVVDPATHKIEFIPATGYVGGDEFTYTVADTEGLRSQPATVRVTVNESNSAPSVSPSTFTIPENSGNGTTIGTVAASDPDTGDTLAYAITAGNWGETFAINATTGTISVANGAALDFETSPSFNLTVNVTDSSNLSSSAIVTVNLTNVNERPTVNAATFSIAENSPNGATVGTVAASDPDLGDALTYSISAGNTDGAFAINSSTGQITVANTAALNFEVTPSFSLTVTVTDQGLLSNSTPVTVSLTNVNEQPTVSSESFSVAENSIAGTVVGTVSASDPDAGTTLSYSITGGNIGGAFTITSATGQITVADPAALDFETTPTFSITVQVSDGQFSGGTTITVTLTNVNEQPTVSAAAFTIAENSSSGATVGTVAASDPDLGDTLTYAIAAGNTGGAFTIDNLTGVLTVANLSALDYETRPAFSLTVSVIDSGSLSSSATITINLTNVNEGPTIGPSSFTIAENSPNGATVGTVAASDPDLGDALIYSITAGNTGGAFAINSATGQITVANSAQLNFEVTPGFSLTVSVIDQGLLSNSATITVNLTNVNEQPTVSPATLSIPENSANATIVGTVSASDPDAGTTLSYSITGGNTSGAFAINSATGQITVANTAALNFEATPSFSLTVRASDGQLSGSATITVNLTNVNETPTIAPQTFTIAEGSANGSVVGMVATVDPDTGDTKTFSITAGNASGAFTINSLTGALTVANSVALVFAVNPTFALTVQVKDSGNLAASNTITVNLTRSVVPLEATQFIVNDGAAQRSNIEKLTVTFNQDTNIAALIATGQITTAARILGPGNIAVPLDASRYSWNASTFTLTIDLTKGGPSFRSYLTILDDGRYQLQLSTSLITPAANGSTSLGGDYPGSAYKTFSFLRLRGDFDGDGVVNSTDLSMFMAVYGSVSGDGRYNRAMDFVGRGKVSLADLVFFRRLLGGSV